MYAFRLSKALTRIAPDLRALGIDIIRDPKNRDKQGMSLFIEKQLKTSTSSTPSTPPMRSKGWSGVDTGVDTKILSTPAQPNNGIGVDGVDTGVDGVDGENLSTPLEPSPSMGGVDGVDGVDKNGSSSSRGDDDEFTDY